MSLEIPRYRCAAERAFLPEGSEIAFAKLGYQVGVGSRVEQDDEFAFEGKPATWMEPINDAAIVRAEALVKSGSRKSVAAPQAAPNSPVMPPKSGMNQAITSTDAFSDVRSAPLQPGPAVADRPAPRRRAAKVA